MARAKPALTSEEKRPGAWLRVKIYLPAYVRHVANFRMLRGRDSPWHDSYGQSTRGNDTIIKTRSRALHIICVFSRDRAPEKRKRNERNHEPEPYAIEP